VNALSEKIQQKLQKMAEDFAASLPDRIKTVKIEAVKAKNGTRESVKNLHMYVHKLGGAAATFGFKGVTKTAKELEQILYPLLEESGKIKSQLWERIDNLVSILEQKCDHSNKQIDGKEIVKTSECNEVTIQPVKKKETEFPEKAIYLFSGNEKNFGEISEQLELFGFNCKYLPSLDKLKEFGDDERKKLVIVDSALLEKQENLEERLYSIKAESENTVNYIFLSDRDDFPLRLCAVRAGGEAYFHFPVEIGRLVDSIDKLTERVEQEPYHVLIVDDDPEQVSYHAHILQQAGMITSVATDPQHVLKVLIEAKPEIVLMDMYMPNCSGRELSAVIRQQPAFVSVPIVFLSVENNEDIKMDAIRSGGDDFLEKPIKPEHLVASISNRVERTRGMRYLMERDSLTGLLNHTNIRENLSREFLRARRTNTEFCFVMIDVDHFKNVNDTYGHLTGDNVLKTLSRLLKERLRTTDIIGRYGGEEFAVILLNTDLRNACNIMNELRESFYQMKQYADDKEFHVAFSCGIASSGDFSDVSSLNEAADKALYTAKETGRNKVVTAQPE